MNDPQMIPVKITRRELRLLPIETQRRIMEQQTDVLIAEIIPYDKHQRALIRGALDSLGVELANHDHIWTEGEREIYEQATALLTVEETIADNGLD